jgi:hypothetical protein
MHGEIYYVLVIHFLPTWVMFGMRAKRDDSNQIAQGWIGDRPCLVIINTGVPMPTTRPDITAGWPKRNQSQCYVLQIASGETLPILKEALVELTLGQEPHVHLDAHSRNHEEFYVLHI